MERITSFCVDHDRIVPGIYVSRIDGDITTYDLRTRIPNTDDLMDHVTMHSMEHMLATYMRNSVISEQVIYFGPMGCRTGFYLLMRDTDIKEATELVKETLKCVVDYNGEVFGSSRKECGNYLDLNLECAQRECREYLENLEKYKKTDGAYDE